jgi:hypothetical protein
MMHDSSKLQEVTPTMPVYLLTAENTHPRLLPSVTGDEISEDANLEYYHMGYSGAIDRFLSGWLHRLKKYRDAYIKESVWAEKAHLFSSLFVVILSLFTASGNIYILSSNWALITTFNIIVSCATIFLAVVLSVLRVWNIQEKRLIGHHTANRLSEIANDIVLNQSLRSEKRLYAAVFIQNVVKRTECVLNSSFSVAPIDPAEVSESERTSVLESTRRSSDTMMPMLHTNGTPCTPGNNNNDSFMNMTDEVHAITGVNPREVLIRAHRHVTHQKELIYVNPRLAHVFSPPFSHTIPGSPPDVDVSGLDSQNTVTA